MAGTPQTSSSSSSRGEGNPGTLWSNAAAGGHLRTMAWISLPLLAVLAGLHMQWLLHPAAVVVQAQSIPAQAQVVDQRSFNGSSLRAASRTWLGSQPDLTIYGVQSGQRACRRPRWSMEPRCSCLPAFHLLISWQSHFMSTTASSTPSSGRIQP